VSRDVNSDNFVGVNWGSSNFRAYRISAGGELLDEFSRPAGVAGLKRPDMEAIMNELVERWPDTSMVYASGMIGSNIGWAEVPYAQAPADIAAVAARAHATSIGRAPVHIVPGISCRREYDGGPDIMRGEEIELFGFAALEPGWNGLLALPGTHTKWARFEAGCITGFFTSMSGEMYDRLTAAGLLASIVEGEASDGPAFQDGVRAALGRKLGMATLLFGARARVIQGLLSKQDAASYLRGPLDRLRDRRRPRHAARPRPRAGAADRQWPAVQVVPQRAGDDRRQFVLCRFAPGMHTRLSARCMRRASAKGVRHEPESAGRSGRHRGGTAARCGAGASAGDRHPARPAQRRSGGGGAGAVHRRGARGRGAA
jgi:2-dehydro-3-deoxygalactonokinase